MDSFTGVQLVAANGGIVSLLEMRDETAGEERGGWGGGRVYLEYRRGGRKDDSRVLLTTAFFLTVVGYRMKRHAVVCAGPVE
jgi:hypothetical protein